MTLAWRQVSFGSPLKAHAGQEPVTLWAEHAREQSPSVGAKRLEWLLLTTVAIEETA